MAEEKSAVSSLLSRMMLALRAGIQFNGARDLYSVYGYPRVITPQMLRDKYLRQDIAQAVIDKPADALWTDPPEIVGDAQLALAWKQLTIQKDLWSTILRADKLLGYNPYVVLLLGVDGDPSVAPSATKQKRERPLIYMQPYGAEYAEIKELYADASKENFGKPASYAIRYADSISGVKTVAKERILNVHESRCVHITNELTDGNLTSSPRLLKGYNLLEDLLKVTGGSAETFWLTANRGMQVDVDKDMDLSPADAQDLSDELDEFQHQLRRFIRTRGVKVNVLGSDVADPRGVFDVLISMLSGTYGIPQRILLGSEAGQLASEQDRANWADSVVARRTTFAEPLVLRPLIDRLIALGVLPVSNLQYTFKWPEAFHLSPLERAQTMAQTARAIVNMSRQAQFGTPITTTEEARHVIGLPGDGGLPPVTDGIPEKEDPEKDDMEEEDPDEVKEGNTPEKPEGSR